LSDLTAPGRAHFDQKLTKIRHAWRRGLDALGDAERKALLRIIAGGLHKFLTAHGSRCMLPYGLKSLSSRSLDS